ncbi:MAG: thrombospondin type 3 repeat-containing protein [Candidatus Andersenbacteria bacterium]
MQSMNRLGIRVAAMTSVVFVAIFGLYFGVRQLLNQRTSENTQLAQASPTPDTTTDTDGDGLPDQFEALYQTNPNLADSDADGTTDAEEINAGRDPNVAGIQDESRPPTGSNVVVQNTYTQKYLASLPEDIAREEILSQARVEAFVSVNQGELLPSLAPDAVPTTAATGKEAVAAYLNSISFKHNQELAEVTSTQIEQAFEQQLQVQTQPINDIVAKLDKNISVLKTIEAPTEVVELHRQLIAASQSLINNTKLLQAVDTDFIGALVGAKNIESLGQVFQQIGQSVKELEVKYGLEDVPVTP